MNTYKEDIFLKDGIEFFREALWNFSAEKWSLAVLHAAIGLEKILKESLVRKDASLVLKNPKRTNSISTVSLDHIFGRFGQADIQLDRDEKRLIGRLTDYRNGIIHRDGSMNHNKALPDVGAIFKFVSDFCKNELDYDIRDGMETEEYERFKNLLKEFDDLVEEARQDAKNEGWNDSGKTYIAYDCPNCMIPETVSRKDDGVYCHLCNEDVDLSECIRCYEYYATSQKEEDYLCDGCQAYIDDQ